MSLLLEMLFYSFLASCLIFYGHVITLQANLKRILVHDKFFPKQYIKPKSWMRKLFKIKKVDHIPKFIYYQCYFIFIYFFIGFLCAVIAIATGEFIIFRHCIVIQAVVTGVQRVFDLAYGCVLKMW